MIEYTGLDPERLFGNEWHTVVHPDDLQRTIDAWTHSLKTGDTYAVEFRVRSRDVEYRLMSQRAVPQREDRGRALR
jgi:PAS domain-containing protein